MNIFPGSRMTPFAKGLLAAAICMGPQIQGNAEARLAALEKVMDRFYRGERIEDAVDRSNRAIKAYNEHALALQAQTEQERNRIQERLDEIEKKRAQLVTLDRQLKQSAGDAKREELRQSIRARNDLAHEINEESDQVGQATEAFNAHAIRIKAEIEKERKRAVDIQAQVNSRLAAYEAFTKSGQDVGFFHELNSLLVELRHALRADPGNGDLQARLARVRGLRRELATWAIETQARKPNGLVIVEATLVDEPCWFVLDTGAMDTIVSEELLDAAGSNQAPEKEKSLSVIGGLRVPGFACRISRLTVSGQSVSDVPASVVPPSDVGVDGLLGQSFLKPFTYTVDDRTPGKLSLTRK